MTTKIAVISDTHCHEWEEVHPKMRDIIAECDIAIHCGDIVRQPVVDGFLDTSQKGIIVHGNSDPVDLRESLPYTEVIEVEKVKIGITHPAWGGPEFPPKELFKDFDEDLDIILFGHTHEPLKEDISGTLFINPGQGYKSFMVDGTMAVITIDNGVVEADILVIEPGR